MSSSHCHVLKPDERILPASHGSQTPHVVQLSAVDASVVRFSKSSAYWIFRGSPDTKESLSTFELLRESLRKTLDLFPHFAGQLKFATDLNEHNSLEASVLHLCGSRQTGRPVISYGTTDDPGVAFRLISSDYTVASLLSCEREERPNISWSTDFPTDELEYSSTLALDSLDTYHSLPGVAVQLTSFKCGGYALNVRTAHCLTDATTLCTFAKAWSNLHRGQPIQLPIFQPEQIDLHGAFSGGTEPDSRRLAIARALPMHRYDWYGPGPDWATERSAATKPSDWDNMVHSPGTPMPWSTWDFTRPVERVELRFSPSVAAHLKRLAQETLPPEHSALAISRLDAVLAHIWIHINRARELHDSAEDVFFNVTLGMRERLGLPETFVGSPLVLFHTRSSGREACHAPLGVLAASFRRTVAQGTAEAIGAYIHDLAFEPSPQRLWQAFLGQWHILFTSWLRLSMQDIEFTGTRPCCARGVMPLLDGLLQTYEADGDLVISLALERDTMKRLLDNPDLVPSGI